MKPAKPLGARSYGSIPHLPESRLGPGDHAVHEGQARIACQEARDRHDLVIVQQKADGSNTCVARVHGVIHALTRAGYPARTSPYRQHHVFADWVDLERDRFLALLEDGERICGEWMLQAHGTRHCLPHEPFVAFDLMSGRRRATYEQFMDRLGGHLVTPQLLHQGCPLPIDQAFERIDPAYHGALDPVEGAVWRVERHGEVEFLCKAVRKDKEDGKYLESVTGRAPVWNSVPADFPKEIVSGLPGTWIDPGTAGSGPER